MMNIIRDSITYKLIFFVFGILVITITTLGCFNYILTRNNMYNRLELQAVTLLDGLNYAIEGYLSNNNITAIDRMLSNFATSREVMSISIVNRKGKTIADTDPAQVGKYTYDNILKNILKTEKSSIQYRTSNGQKFLLLVKPLRGKVYLSAIRSDVVGAIYLKLHTELIDEEIINDFLLNLFIFGLIIIIAFLVTTLISRKIFIKPIKIIEYSASLIGKGNLDVRIPKLPPDELGQLAIHLNDMTRHISTLTNRLSHSNSYLESIFISINSMLFVTDKNGFIKKVNKATLQLLGFDQDEVIDHQVKNFFGGIELENKNRKLIINQDEINFIKKDGTKILTLTSISPVKNINGKILGFVIIARDITEYKKLEEEIFATKQQIYASRQAGMAEVATGILHNIGNVLNSINVSIGFLKNKLSASQLNHLHKVSDLMNQHTNDSNHFLTSDSKGRLIPAYINELANLWLNEQTDYLKECENLTKNINHIKEIITMQQKFAMVYNIVEPLDLASLIEDAIKINMLHLPSIKINIIRDFEKLDPIKSDKAKILQILINLIKNANEALFIGNAIEKNIILRIKCSENNTVKIYVIDNGIGISPENINKIFSYGYTTKKSGHGFGLHACIFTAKELNGSLTVSSDGLNKGSTFLLTLPYNIKTSYLKENEHILHVDQ
ncbi:MAG: PAS/PAC sensor signal transduction histidine kinase [uncultured bacterium]|nr:MAG: PAS/PAC sensor signal transduction histidine kinase [uncultured bacterium]